jgi:hypothetical protein
MDEILREGGRGFPPGALPRVESLKNRATLAQHRAEVYLLSSERDVLRRIIQGTVASMTADKLAARYEIGLEHDRRYDLALADFCRLIVSPRVRPSRLRDFLRDDLPQDQPDFVRILFIETVSRMLGQRWVSGDCSFVDVSIGVARLQELIRSLSFEYRGLHAAASAPFVVLTTPYGEQHTLMLHLLGLLFDALGWTSLILEGEDARGARLRTAIEQADIVCIGWSNIRLRPAFTQLVDTIKLQRPHTRPPIVTGGVAALESVDFLVGLGIDCICDSVYAASRICESFYELEKFGQQAKTSGRKAAGSARGTDWLKR